MSAGSQAVLFAIAFVAFVVAAILAGMRKDRGATLIALGLAAWVFVSLWVAVKAA